MPSQPFQAPDAQGHPPTNFAAIASTTTATRLWLPGMHWTPVPAGDMKAGKQYIVEAGGVWGNTSTPTIIITPRIGTAETTSDATLGASVTFTTTAGYSASNWYLRFLFGVRSLGIGASGATVYGNGFFVSSFASTSLALTFGGTAAATVDQTVNNALTMWWTWGTSNASNTITCHWVSMRSLN
jgi:hypothetical protein